MSNPSGTVAGRRLGEGRDGRGIKVGKGRAVRRAGRTVWFELHEDLLATLGTPRGEEADVSAETH